MVKSLKKHPVFEALKLNLEREISLGLQNFRFLRKDIGVKILYHYTDLNGLKGIIENQSFFSSNSAYLNDKEEFYYGRKLFEYAIIEYASKSKDKILVKEIHNELKNKKESYHYVTCFSLDGDLLSQWRAYSDDGKGISIGFDLNNLKEIFTPKAAGVLIEYKSQVQKQAAIKIVGIAVDFYKSKLPLLENLEQEQLHEVIAQEVYEVFNKYIGQFKHSSFKEEKEFRFDLSIDLDINKSRELSYRVSKNNLLVPYLNLKSNFQDEVESLSKSYPNESLEAIQKRVKHRIKHLPIKEIIIGPSLDFELNKKSILGFLKKNGHTENIKIKQSKVPYRI